jgi:phosphatidylserine decarboxylase
VDRGEQDRRQVEELIDLAAAVGIAVRGRRSFESRMPIAREGRWPLTLVVVAGLIIGIAVDWPSTWAVWGLAILLAFVFRQPARAVDASPLAVLSPVDGRVEAVEEGRDPFTERPALRITLRQSLSGPYVVYAPTEGKLQRLRGSSRAVALLIQTDEGDDLTLEVGYGRLIRYLHCGVSAGERTRQGGVCGFAGFGRRMRLYMPPDTRILAEQGARLRAGQPVAKLQHHGV